MNRKERAEKAIELLKEAKDCLEGSGGYAPVYNPGQKLDELEINDDWLPTPENINALPDPVRKLIHDIETNVDPQGMVRENVLIKDVCKSLLMKLEEKLSVTEKFVEKWIDVMKNYNDWSMESRVKDMLKEAGVKVVKK